MNRITNNIDDVPHKVSEKCEKITAQVWDRLLKAEYLESREICPGKCRFCGHNFEYTHVRLNLYGPDKPPLDMPITSCDRAAIMWDDYWDKIGREKFEKKNEPKQAQHKSSIRKSDF